MLTHSQPPLPESSLVPAIHQLGTAYGLPENWLENRPYLYSPAICSLSAQQEESLRKTITAIEQVTTTTAYQAHAMAWATPSGRHKPANPGVFFGYDFHLTADGAKLIEINTNAAGAALNMLLYQAYAKPIPYSTEASLVSIFLSEWEKCRSQKPLTRIAIVDHAPTEQYFYPEFLLWQSLFKKHGIETIITGPSELHYEKGKLFHKTSEIDLVYNRLTDFTLAQPQHAPLLNAWLEDAVVLTPHPHAYALYADKRNLILLSNPSLLKSWGIDETTIGILEEGVPRTFIVEPEQAEMLWQSRKTLFFKPIQGYGGKGSYRGLSIRQKAFAEILKSHYIAQVLVPPPEILSLKYDVRCYVYQGKIHDTVARFYSGQVTNFRAPGSGFGVVAK